VPPPTIRPISLNLTRFGRLRQPTTTPPICFSLDSFYLFFIFYFYFLGSLICVLLGFVGRRPKKLINQGRLWVVLGFGAESVLERHGGTSKASVRSLLILHSPTQLRPWRLGAILADIYARKVHSFVLCGCLV
jgi:hypothetical protein